MSCGATLALVFRGAWRDRDSLSACDGFQATFGSLEAVEPLRRCSLIERGDSAGFTLPPVVLEYVTDRLVERAAEEITREELDLLLARPLVRALSGDRLWLAAGTTTGEVCLWRVADRRLRTPFDEQWLAGLLTARPTGGQC